jgi:DNA-binding MarR family transcriptional regulator
MRDQFTGDDGIVLDNAMAFWIARVYLASRGILYRRFRAHGAPLTPEQWMVLVRLWEAEGVTQAHMAARTLRDEPTISRIVAVMERDGLIERRADPADRRSRLLYLTERGRSLRRTLVPEARAMVRESLAGIPEDDLVIARRVLQRMAENLA